MGRSRGSAPAPTSAAAPRSTRRAAVHDGGRAPATARAVNVVGHAAGRHRRPPSAAGAGRRFRLLYRSGPRARRRRWRGSASELRRPSRWSTRAGGVHRGRSRRGIVRRGPQRRRTEDGAEEETREPDGTSRVCGAGVVGAGHMGQYHVLGLRRALGRRAGRAWSTSTSNARSGGRPLRRPRPSAITASSSAWWTWPAWRCRPSSTSTWRAICWKPASTCWSRSR